MKRYIIFAICLFSIVFTKVSAAELDESFIFSVNNSEIKSTNTKLDMTGNVITNFNLHPIAKYNKDLTGKSLTTIWVLCTSATLNEGSYLDGKVLINKTGTCSLGNLYDIAQIWSAGGVVGGTDVGYWLAYHNMTIENVRVTNSRSHSYILESVNTYFTGSTELQEIEQNRHIINQQQQTNDKLDEQNKIQQEQNDFLMDDTQPDVDISSLGTVSGLLPAGPIDSLLNIPFKFLSVLTSSLSGTCTPISGTFVFDTTLTIPCFSDSFYNEVPEFLMNFLSLIPAGFILITYFKYLYKKVERATSMETTADDEWGVI